MYTSDKGINTMDKSKEQEYLNQVEENKNKFLKDNNLKTKMLLTQATNVVLTGRLLTKAVEDEKTNEKLTTNVATKEGIKLNQADYDLLVHIFRTIVTDVCKLTPEMLDALWSTKLLATMQLNSIASKICSETSEYNLKICLFDKKKVCLKEAFPEYYEETYGNTYDIRNVLDAEDSVLRNINLYGKIKKSTKGSYHTPSKGKVVDELIAEALETFFDLEGIHNVEEKLRVCAEAKKNGLKSLGVYKILANRGIHNKSFLDFYFKNNLSRSQQFEYVRLYAELRKKYQKKPDKVTEFLDTFIKRIDEASKTESMDIAM